MLDLEFGGKSKEPDIRWLYDMKDVIYDQEWLSVHNRTMEGNHIVLLVLLALL